MNLRTVPALLLAYSLTAATGAGHAQLAPTDARSPTATIRITPFAAWAPAVTRVETWHTPTAEGGEQHRIDFDLGTGYGGGLDLEYRLHAPVSLLLGGMYVRREDAVFGAEDGDRLIFTGSDNIFARTGLSVQLHEPGDDMALRRLAASLFAAPFYQLELPREIATISGTNLFDSANHFGVSFGGAGELPFGDERFALQLAFEDYLTWWDEDALARLPMFLRHDTQAGPSVVSARVTSQWLLRAGVNVRFH